MSHIEGSEIKRIRERLGESQGTFAARFGKVRRTVIRWEQTGHYFSSWVPWHRSNQLQLKGLGKGKKVQSEQDVWDQAVKNAAAPKTGRRRRSGPAKAPAKTARARVRKKKAKRVTRARGRVTRGRARK